MNEISCEMCMDLMPLVNDGVASNDSRCAVENHIKSCDTCRAYYDGTKAPEVNTEKALSNIVRKVQAFMMFILMFGIFFGLGLTAGENMFYNSVLMPVIGVVGYLVFRWKAIYTIPLILFASDILMFIPQMLEGAAWVDFYSLLIWTVIYSVLAILGTIIAWLLHFTFRKERS